MKRTISFTMTTIVMFVAFTAAPQTYGDLDIINDAAVKSVDEFISRFNGNERHPQVADDSMSRKNTLMTLFNWGDNPDQSTLDDGIVSEFLDSALVMTGMLDLDSGNTWCELHSEFSIDGRRVDITFILERERNELDEARWGIVAVKGLKSSGLLNDKLAKLSPVDHELSFISFDDWFNSNPQLVPSLRSSSTFIDQKSFLMGLAYSGKLKYKYPTLERFHFMEVPGFIFSIEKETRNSVNTGWLINHIERAGDFNKLEYLNKLFIE